jgi:hypothetical protein
MPRLLLDIEFEADPMEGTLREESGEEHSFVGWLGLADALGRLAEREGSREPEPKARPRARRRTPSPGAAEARRSR